MKFGERFKFERVRIWREHYVDYAKLKSCMYAKFAPSNANAFTMSLLGSESEFEQLFDSEAAKADAFYCTTLDALKQEVKLLKEQSLLASPSSSSAHSTRLAYVDVYRRANFLSNFYALNYTALLKILSKHDKNARLFLEQQGLEDDGHSLASSKKEHLESLSFADPSELTKLIGVIEGEFAATYCDGDTVAARAELQIVQATTSKKGQFWLGFRCGSVVILALWLLWDCVVDASLRRTGTSPWHEPGFKIFTTMGTFVFLVWCWGLNLLVWRRYRVNYHLILELDHRTKTSSAVFSEATNITFVYLGLLLLFYKSQRSDVGDFPSWLTGWKGRILPFVLVVYMALRAVFPWKLRRSIWATLFEIVRSPFGKVRFREFYIADVLTSLVKPIFGLCFATCYFVSGQWLHDTRDEGMCAKSEPLMQVIRPLVSALPLWFRFMQCIRRYHDTHQRFPNIFNAAKYGIAHTVVLMGVFAQTDTGDDDWYRMVWIASLVVSTMCTFMWDVKMDWALGTKLALSSPGRDTPPLPRSAVVDCFRLRDQLMFRHKWVYYTAIVFDLVFRFLWTLTLVPVGSSPLGTTVANLLDPFLSAAEVLRRTVWGMLRVEAEHLHNTEGYRSVNIIPLHFETATVAPRDDDQSRDWRTNAEVLLSCALLLAFGIVSLMFGKM